MQSTLEKTRRTLDRLGLMDKPIRTPRSDNWSTVRLSEIIPEPETDNNVRTVRALNQLFDAIGDEELSPEAWRELYKLRGRKETEALSAVNERCEVEQMEGPMTVGSHKATDPVSKVSMNVSYVEGKNMAGDPAVWARNNLAQEVVMMR